MKTDVAAFVQDLDGGTFESKLAQVLSDVAASVIDNQRKGQVTLTFDISRIGSSYQVSVAHTLAFKRPTLRGEMGEKETVATPMHVGQGGRLSLFPENQGQLFSKQGTPDPHLPTPTIGEND